MPPGTKPRLPANQGRIALTGVNDLNSPWANIYHVRATLTDGPPVLTDWIYVLSAFGALFRDTILEETSSANKFLASTGTFILGPDEELHASVSFNESGDGDASVLTGQAAAVISWASRGAWRGGRPRTYIAGIPRDAVDDAVRLDPAFATALLSSAATFLPSVADIATDPFATLELGFSHAALHNVWIDPPVFFPIEGASVHPFIRTQRRRVEHLG